MHKVVCLCVHSCFGRKFGISQHRLVTAVEAAAVFFETMITSSPFAPTLQRTACADVCMFMCARPACTSALPLRVRRETHPALPSHRCTGLSLFHMWLRKIPHPLTPATKHRAPFELCSLCVIRLNTGNMSTRVNLRSHLATKHKAWWFIFCYL